MTGSRAPTVLEACNGGKSLGADVVAVTQIQRAQTAPRADKGGQVGVAEAKGAAQAHLTEERTGNANGVQLGCPQLPAVMQLQRCQHWRLGDQHIAGRCDIGTVR